MFCPESSISPDRASNSIQQENGRDYKSLNVLQDAHQTDRKLENVTQNSGNFLNAMFENEIIFIAIS